MSEEIVASHTNSDFFPYKTLWIYFFPEQRHLTLRCREAGTQTRTIQHCHQLPAEVLETFPRKPATFKRRVREVLTEVN